MGKAYLVLALLLLTTPSLAQEMYLHGGVVKSPGEKSDSIQWSLAYMQPVGEHAVFSFTYFNEGEVAGHHRDGWSPQIWLRAHTPGGRLSAAAGLGPYFFSDTISNDRPKNFDAHGWGGVFSTAVTWRAGDHLLFQVRGNWIETVGNFAGLSVTGGVGCRFEPSYRQGAQEGAEVRATMPENELALFSGLVTLNSARSVHSIAESFEYRRVLNGWLEWTGSFINEGPRRQLRRYGVASQLWLARDFEKGRLAFAAGVGPYLFHDKYRGADGSSGVAALIGLSTSYRFTGHFALRFTWNRVATDCDRDADLFLAGVAYRF